MQIVLAKSVAGEFFIGKLTEKDNLPMLIDVYSVNLHPASQKQGAIVTTIIPVMFPFDDSSIKEISMHNIIAIISAPEELEATYVKITTGIEVVKPNLKIN